jgi:hypothetical protein
VSIVGKTFNAFLRSSKEISVELEMTLLGTFTKNILIVKKVGLVLIPNPERIFQAKKFRAGVTILCEIKQHKKHPGKFATKLSEALLRDAGLLTVRQILMDRKEKYIGPPFNVLLAR